MKLPMADGPERARAVEALRHEAAGALERGLGFVETHGDELAVLRALVVLEARPVEDLVSALAARQRDDGSFPALGLASGGALGLAQAEADGLATPILGGLEALCVLADAGAPNAEPVPALAAFLGAAQHEDGTWESEDDAPETRLFVTGMLTGLLGRAHSVRPAVLDRGALHVSGQWDPDRIEGRAWAALTAFAVFFSGVDHELADGALQWIGRELERGYRTRIYDAAETLRVLLHCDATAVPGATLSPEQLLRDVLAEQAPDGGFAELAPGGAARRVSQTLDCMLGILRLCRVL